MLNEPKIATIEPSSDEAVACSRAPRGRVTATLRKVALLCLAALSFAIGVLGVVLPGLPATPFLLLTSFFLLRSSPRLNALLLRSRLFGPILTDWQKRGGVRPHVKCKSIIAVVILVSITIFFTGYSPATTLATLSLAIVGIAVIVRLPAARDA